MTLTISANVTRLEMAGADCVVSGMMVNPSQPEKAILNFTVLLPGVMAKPLRIGDPITLQISTQEELSSADETGALPPGEALSP